ncbi:MAG: thioredoxin [Alphaproteobacteria bacterium]
MTLDVTQETFDAEVKNADQPVVVDVWATWCGPCKMLSPVIDALDSEMDNVKFVKINADENQELTSRLGVRNLPTLLLFKNGEVESVRMGAAPKGQILSWINQNI